VTPPVSFHISLTPGHCISTYGVSVSVVDAVYGTKPLRPRDQTRANRKVMESELETEEDIRMGVVSWGTLILLN